MFKYENIQFEAFRNFTEDEQNHLSRYLQQRNGLRKNPYFKYDYDAFCRAATADGTAAADIYLSYDDGEFYVPCSDRLLPICPEGFEENRIRYFTRDLSPELPIEVGRDDCPVAVCDSGEDYTEYFPTPERLSKIMLDWTQLRGIKTILEPSAGRGDLIDAVKSALSRTSRTLRIEAVEIVPLLQNTLRAKGIPVIHDDFLSLRTEYRYDLIIMNPPFSRAAEHIMKAMEMQARNGGYLIALCNANTIRNAYSNTRKELLRILKENNAKIIFVKNAFSGADAIRNTDVEVAIIQVHMKEPEQKDSDFFNHLLREEENMAEQANPEGKNTLVPFEFVQQMVARYRAEVSAGLELIRMWRELQPYLKDSLAEPGTDEAKYSRNMLELQNADPNDFVHNVRIKYWTAALKNPELYRRLTSNVQERWINQIQELAVYDFSEFNINNVLREMAIQLADGVETSMLHYFEKFTRYALYDGSENIHYYNGWRTNSSYKVAEKVILPCYGVVHEKNSIYSHTGLLDVYRAYETISDIEKVFSYLDRGTAEVDLSSALQNASAMMQNRKIRLKYFDVSFFKKGTVHIMFRPETRPLLDAFNIFCARKKNWLPGTYGSVRYEDMDQEERAVIDSFQGKDAYEKVLQDRALYLQEPDRVRLMQLTA